MANKKIEDFYQSFNILKNNYLKYKQDNDKKMMLLIQCNDDLKKELEEKKNIQMYNDQCKIRMDDFNRSTILLEYYEIKNKVNNVNKTILWNKINMLYCHLYDERRKDKNDEINIFIENRKVDSNDATNKQPNNKNDIYKNDIYKNDIYKNDIYNDIYKNDIYNDNYNNRSENNNFHALIDQLKIKF
ncbi:hypothetical protein PFDG_04614 [Plasmodium falciparum Dd2]|uniref:Uncharacterized protein n=1 Tax=Plasmodium falciparum (isolate Dd2) TaxID=57267 RepID=A0A0L7M5P0_PLAF4|nr:hypothetical protein PFDG_04614 [Plasmodium falciparum Dd2]